MASKKWGNHGPEYDKPKGAGMTQRYKNQRGAQNGTLADWDRAEGEAIRVLVSTVCSQGGAVLLGYSRDRGAYRVIIMDDDDKITEWIPCTTDLNEALYNLAAELSTTDDGS